MTKPSHDSSQSATETRGMSGGIISEEEAQGVVIQGSEMMRPSTFYLIHPILGENYFFGLELDQPRAASATRLA